MILDDRMPIVSESNDRMVIGRYENNVIRYKWMYYYPDDMMTRMINLLFKTLLKGFLINFYYYSYPLLFGVRFIIILLLLLIKILLIITN